MNLIAYLETDKKVKHYYYGQSTKDNDRQYARKNRQVVG